MQINNLLVVIAGAAAIAAFCLVRRRVQTLTFQSLYLTCTLSALSNDETESI
jgi:uncharacterized membrane protein YccC